MEWIKAVPGIRAAALASRAWRLRSIEWWLRISTAAAPERPVGDTLPAHFGDGKAYDAADYRAIWHCMRHLRIGPEDVFVDIGCGLGRVLCVFARRRLKKCIGIEYSRTLAAVAQRNAERLRGRRTPIEIWLGDAAEADYSEATIFWLFNPFGPDTLRLLMERIEESLAVAPRRIQVVYLYGQHEEVLHSFSWLHRVKTSVPPFQKRATYWTNLP